jgi:hypothetical protein
LGAQAKNSVSPTFLRAGRGCPSAFSHAPRPSRRFGIHKAGNQAGREQREEYMIRLMTVFELQQRTQTELHALFRQASQALARSAAETPERRIALASLENISQALAFSLAAGPGI